MRYIVLKADKAGESHFEHANLELNEADYRPPAPLLFVSHAYQAGWPSIYKTAFWLVRRIHSSAQASISYLFERTPRSDDQRRRKAEIRSGRQRVDGGCLRKRSSHAGSRCRRVRCRDHSNFCQQIIGQSWVALGAVYLQGTFDLAVNLKNGQARSTSRCGGPPADLSSNETKTCQWPYSDERLGTAEKWAPGCSNR